VAVLVHSKSAEEKFIAEGEGVKLFPVMYNDFVLFGPKDDPAGIKGMNDAIVVRHPQNETKSPRNGTTWAARKSQ
jgi:tungstate transport system substrate-binding protein